jgi:elongator complex protein 1
VDPSDEPGEGREDLLESIVLPGLLDSVAQIKENLGEIRAQIDKQRVRVQELRAKKLAEPGM